MFTGTIAELLGSQDLKEVFKSFKEHELEFETYLRPILREEEVREDELSEDNDHPEKKKLEKDGTWAFLQKSILSDNRVCTDIIHEDQRNRFISKMTKLRMNQQKLLKDAEKKRLLDEAKQLELLRIEEERSRAF